MLRSEPAHIVVTGTSGSIGASLARALHARFRAAHLTLVDVEETRSRALSAELGGNTTFERCDLSRVDEAAAMIERVAARQGPVHGLVNCAGFMEVRAFERLAWQRAETLLMVDLVTPLRLMHAVVPTMLDAGRGFVVNVASMAGKVTIKGCAFYCAAKGGLAMASEIAHSELRARGVDVLTVYPGAVASPLEARAKAQYGNTLLARYIPTGDPDELATVVVRALDERRPRVVYPRLYAVGLTALASPFALAVGPSPVD